MYRQLPLLFGAALFALANAQQPPITTTPAVQSTAVPQKIAKRQDNVKKTIEIHQDYGAPIGVDTQYLTMDGGSTKASYSETSMTSNYCHAFIWIGVDAQYLTEETRTSTVDNVEKTTVVKPQLAVVTATEATEGVEVGDVTVLMSDVVQDELDALIKDAAASCGTGVKLRKRDAMSCMINTIQGAAENDETLGLINPAEWDAFVLKISEHAPEALAGAVQVLKTQAQKNKFAIMMAAAVTAGVLAETEPIAEVAHKFIFDDGLFGYPAENSDEGNDDGKPSPTEQPTASSASSCDPSATVDENSPACSDEDCKGEEGVCQAEGEKKNCPCAHFVKRMIEGHFDKEWADAQQRILQELEAGVPEIIPPQCFRNTHGDGFDGKPKAEPSAFCHCSSKESRGGMTKGNFPTMSGEGDKACTYTTMPTETISITSKPKETEITSCRVESSDGGEAYCTCNDDKMHGTIVMTYQGKEKTVCPDTTATMTDIEPAIPTEEPSCYQTYGAPHDDADKDELIKLCRASRSEFAEVCRLDANNFPGVKVGCPGKNDAHDDSFSPPIDNNHYKVWFEKVEDAPEYCKYIFKQGGSDDDDEVGRRVDALCIPVLQAIRDKCTWNGGEAKNQCGTFKYQACKFGGSCNWEEP